MTIDPAQLVRLVLWLAALGAVVIVAGKVVGRTAGKASSAL